MKVGKRNMNAIEIEYKNRKPEGHFFDDDTKRFFRSRVGAVIEFNNDGPVYFLTSEQFVSSTGHRAPRCYTARVMDPDGTIESVGPFNKFSRSKALRLAREAAELKLTAKELGAGGIALKEALEAKQLWEQAGGSITPEVEKKRRNADEWAKQAGWRLEWSSITPHVHRNGRDFMLSQLLQYID